ncbi:MAG: T9SS type A sorting domain-containing protein [Candidatus Cloacimonetes bacterium]|nr:T9SS type A sorting domain-containing protein [Candidatus Cloacimonadota bacterium]
MGKVFFSKHAILLLIAVLPLVLLGEISSALPMNHFESMNNNENRKHCCSTRARFSSEVPVLGAPNLMRAFVYENQYNYEDLGPFVLLLWSRPIYSNTVLLGYNVYRNGELIAEKHHLNPLDDIGDAYYDEYPLLNLGIYEYSVTAVYTDGESEHSDVKEIGYPVTAPPTDLRAVVEFVDDHPMGIPFHVVDLSWSSPVFENTAISGYNIYRNDEYFRFTRELNSYHWVFLDTVVTYEFYVVALYVTGEIEQSEIISITIDGNTSELDEVQNFTYTRLGNNYPNPFNPNTTIYFELSQDAHVSLDIFNIRGQMIKSLTNQRFEAGRHTLQWDGIDFQGNSASSGVYFYKMQTDGFIEMKRMLLLK